jgi:Flp pilus assembly protein TadG
MIWRRHARNGQRGQTLVLFALVMSLVIIPAIGLVVDGGYALAQRRAVQNASDFGALAGARIIAERIAGNTSDGTDANVQAAITQSIAVNKGTPITFGPPAGPRYVNSSGAFACHDGSGNAQTCNAGNQATSYVGNGYIPVGGSAVEAVGVTVGSSRAWTPFFVGAIVGTWTASATATAKGGYYAGGPGGNVFPAGIAEAVFLGRSPCVGDATGNVGGPGACDPVHLTPGSLNVPGGFGWLKFGCDGYGLGQVPPANVGGCQNSKVFLQTEIGPPANSFGCCTQVKLPGSPDFIGSLPGNKASADCTYYIDNKVVVTVPVWDYAAGTGQNAYYHIVGFTGWQVTACDGGKDLEGVFRQQFFLGPTTTTPGFAGASLAVQLVH